MVEFSIFKNRTTYFEKLTRQRRIFAIILLLILISCHTGCRTSSNNRIRLFSAPSNTQFNSQSPTPTPTPIPTPIPTPTPTPTSTPNPNQPSTSMSSSVLSPVDSSDKIRVNTTNHSDNSPPFFSGPASISNAASTTQSASNAVTDPSIIDGNRYEAFRPIIPNHIVSPPVSTTNPNTVSPVENTIVEKPKITDDSNSAVNETNELKKQITDLEAELKKVKESPPPITPNFSSDNPKELSPETIATTTISDSQKDEQIKIDSSNKENHLPLPHFNVEGITTTKDNNAIRISIVDTLLFMNTSWKLTPDAEELLRRITTEIQAAYSDVEIDVEGHTDNLDVDPKNPTQKHEISTIKAGIVMDYCVKTLKCNPAKMKIIPYGSKRPIENNSTAKGRAKNNRIEIVIIPTK